MRVSPNYDFNLDRHIHCRGTNVGDETDPEGDDGRGIESGRPPIAIAL
jgi:hypothetical protein